MAHETPDIIVQIKDNKTIVEPATVIPPIVAQVKGGAKTQITFSPSGNGPTRLIELSDVDADPLANGDVLTYIAANSKFEFHPIIPGANAFGVVNVSGQSSVIADSTSDTLTLVAGIGISIITDAPNDTITITNSSPDTTIDQFARDRANGAFTQANAAYTNANTAIYTAAQIRANISNTAPINYDSTTGIISHADSSVTPGTYGNTTFVPTVTVDIKGHVTTITNTAIALPPSTDEFARAQANAAFNKANGAAQNSFTTISVANQSSVVADSNTDTLTLVSGNGISITTNSISDSITISASQPEVLTFDDFISGGYTSFSPVGGKLGWYNRPSGSGVIGAAQEIDHPGIVRLSTGVTPGSTAWMHTQAARGFVKFHDKWNMQSVIKLVTVDSGTQTAISMGFTIGYGGEYTRFEKLFADSNIFAVTANSTTTTRVSVLAPVANTWYRFGIRKERGNTENVVFSIDGVDMTSINTSLPSGASAFAAQFLLDTNAAANKELLVDYWQIVTGNTLPTGLGVR